MINIISHQGDESKNYNETSYIATKISQIALAEQLSWLELGPDTPKFQV